MTSGPLPPGDAMALLRRLVAIPSVSGDEGAIADEVAAEMARHGLPPRRQGHNVWCTIGRGAPHLLLNSHLDTVPPCAGWHTDPHEPVWDGDQLVGLGANDAKGCGAAMLLAVVRLHAAGFVPRGRVTVALTAEEETGGQGLATILPALGPLDAALVGEPTRLEPCVAQRGILLLRCIAEGVSGHVAHAGVVPTENAVSKAARDVARIEAWRPPAHPVLGQTRAQVVTIQGGLAENQVPDRCEMLVDLRTTPNLDHAALRTELDALLESRVTVEHDHYLPKETAADAPIVRAALSAADVDAPVGSSTASDWCYLGDVPTVKVGPGDTHRSHRPNEYLRQDELDRAVTFYADTIRGFFSERPHRQ